MITKPSNRSLAEEAFKFAWNTLATKAPPEREYLFHDERRWRFDFAWPSIKLAVEIDGRGRHQTVAGVRGDCEKHNEAIRLGWRVLRFPATDKRLAADWAQTVLEVMCCPPA